MTKYLLSVRYTMIEEGSTYKLLFKIKKKKKICELTIELQYTAHQ